MTVETLAFKIIALAHFVIIIAVAAAVDANTHVCVGKELAKSNFAVEIDRSHGQPERDVGAEKSGIVVVIVGVE